MAAEAIAVIGAVSTMAGICAVTLQAGKALHDTIKNYQTHQPRVLDLLDENGALNGAIESLHRTLASGSDLDLSALEIPLTRCGIACQEFAREIEEMSSLSGGRLAKLRGWARLRYMGEDIDGFRRLLAGYKTTITIALADANLQRSTLTSMKIEGYSLMIQTATAEFEDRLQKIDETLDSLVHATAASSALDPAQETATEVQRIQQERLSTEKCLQICTQLSDHISQLRAGKHGAGAGTATPIDPDSVPERITDEGLGECEESLSRMAQRLGSHEKTLFTQLAEMMSGSSFSGKNVAEVARLRDEWESTHRQMELLSKAEQKLQETVSVIQNHATGDALQIMVSANGKPLHGTNKANGPGKQFQAGGLMSDETVQTVVREMARMGIATYEKERANDNEHAGESKAKSTLRGMERARGQAEKGRPEESNDDSQFEDLYGEGRTLVCESPNGSRAEK